MTREEAIRKLRKHQPNDCCLESISLKVAIDMAIKALEQQPCDAISREAALEKMADYVASGYADSAEDYEEYSRIICQLPPVTPQQKMGRWILSGGYWRCSECKEKALLKLDKSKGGCREYEPVRSKHCPSCGIKMQESEVKE